MYMDEQGREFMDRQSASLQGLFDLMGERKPRVGRRVIVRQDAKVKKTRGLSGVVTWHGVDQFAAPRYCSKWDMAGDGARIARGTSGFRVRVQPDEGAAFFVSAADVAIMEITA